MSEKKEYIERGALLLALGEKRAVLNGLSEYGYLQVIREVPAADVEPVVRGEWKEFDADMNAYSCSVCNEPQMFIEGNPEQNEYSFCPYCGAHMERSGSGE